MIWLRSLVFVVWMYGAMLVLGTLCLPLAFGGRRHLRGAVRAWVRVSFWGLKRFCGVTWEVRGAENLPKGAALVASKHQSMFDTLAPWLFLDDPAIILKQELTALPVFGWYAQRLRNIVVDRKAGASALKAMVGQAKALAAEGRQILIFPEGTRTAPGERERYKPGAAALYAALDAPCAPIALNSGRFWPASGILRRPGRIVVQVLEPIPPGLDKRAFLELLETRIEEAAAALDAASSSSAPPAPQASRSAAHADR